MDKISSGASEKIEYNENCQAFRHISDCQPCIQTNCTLIAQDFIH